MTPLVSVIMPVRNGSNYIKEALESLLNQDFPIEIILVDDGSSDNTAEIAGEYGCVVISHDVPKGPVVAKNTGLTVAKGDYILFMDHDDKMRDGALKALLKAFDQAPDAYAVQAMVKDFKSPDCESGALTIRPEPYYGLFTGAILIRRKAFDIIGPFPTDHSAGEIIDWSDRMREHGLEVKKTDLVSADRRVHQSNFGRTRRAEEMKNYAAILRARLKTSLD